MTELTLEAVAERLAALERQVAALTASADVIPATRDWRSVVGMFDGSEFMRQVDAEIEAMRAAEQRALDEGAAA
ncbi:MAG: hypothetical protein K2X82_24140 [Gemmataceae bacterium]|nr:hypothetical protein [Gemmataceae bacterium]